MKTSQINGLTELNENELISINGGGLLEELGVNLGETLEKLTVNLEKTLTGLTSGL